MPPGELASSDVPAAQGLRGRALRTGSINWAWACSEGGGAPILESLSRFRGIPHQPVDHARRGLLVRKPENGKSIKRISATRRERWSREIASVVGI